MEAVASGTGLLIVTTRPKGGHRHLIVTYTALVVGLQAYERLPTSTTPGKEDVERERRKVGKVGTLGLFSAQD